MIIIYYTRVCIDDDNERARTVSDDGRSAAVDCPLWRTRTQIARVYALYRAYAKTAGTRNTLHI